MTKICVTGHRPDKLGGYDDKAVKKLEKFCFYYLEMQDKDLTIITGMAQGFDQAIADACYKLRIRYIAAIPCLGQEKMWPKKAQERYNSILELADEVHYVSKDPYRYNSMMNRNRWMVDNSDFVLALWNGTLGGTKNCVDYAGLKNKQVLNIWKEYEQYNRLP